MTVETFPKRLKHGHLPGQIRKRLNGTKRAIYGKDIVYGGVDGVITTFAVVAGVEGAQLSSAVALILGLANLLADGFSMAASNYLSVRTENEERALLLDFERYQVEKEPSGEIEEIREIFRKKGFKGKLLEAVTEQVVKDKDLWLETMMLEEYGMGTKAIPPLKPASITFCSFLIFGSIPLIPFILDVNNKFLIGSICSIFAFFLIGSLKSRWSSKSPLGSGLSTMVLGTIAATISFLIGKLLGGLAL